MKDAPQTGVEAHEEMISSGQITNEHYYRCLADHLKLDFVTAQQLQNIQLTKSKGIIHALRYSSQILHRDETGALILVTAPKREEIERLRYQLTQLRGLNSRIAIAEPSEIRQAYLRHLNKPLSQHASQMLHRQMPSFSAYQIANGSIIVLIILIIFLLIISAVTPNSMPSLVLNSIIAFVFFLSVSLRFGAAFTLRSNKERLLPTPVMAARNLPVYSVLVAAYDEASIIPDLVDALSNLNWPVAKLDIKIILEENDQPTITAARLAISGRSAFEIIIVPPGQPRTKPRALNYALPLARGEYVVIYDAEDRPHPDQLKAAYYKLSKSTHEVACIQAPLLIDNAKHTWLSAMFALEYAGLFDGVIPAFARWKFPVLLGGTSNHFRTKVLRSIGAWDPYNVTEDADLGIRLKRYGYRVEVIDLPTYEEAPAGFIIWLKQRTRWFKGWMQTSLVHMRAPKRTFSQLGWRGFFTFHLISTSLLISALGYPFFLTLIVYHIHRAMVFGAQPDFAFAMALNLLFAFVTYAYLSYRALSYRDQKSHSWYALSLPFYWVLLSFAAWRALVQLVTAPHVWEKTPHGKVSRVKFPWLTNKNFKA
ncbi:MAG: glycosyltransferase family 2 protein [Hyphomicrobiales bacterium]